MGCSHRWSICGCIPLCLRCPDGRHSRVLTKLHALGLTDLKKVLLIDADLLPRRSLDYALQFRPPAAMLMPANLPHASVLASGQDVPDAWLDVCPTTGAGGRVNAGVCLLEPDTALLEYISQE